VGLGGVFGYLALLVRALPEVVVVPILVFIGLEIGAQAFRLVPERQAPAVAACFLPVIADLGVILAGQILAGAGVSPDALQGDALALFRGLTLLANGFVFSSLLLGAMMSFLLDDRLGAAAVTLLLAALAALFGLIHSPLPSGAVFLPWRLADRTPYLLAGGYALAAVLTLGLRSTRPAAPAHSDP
jgi:AGZA family xanthine/uracil permease-like MFS transporter